jgi:hypothetical protein
VKPGEVSRSRDPHLPLCTVCKCPLDREGDCPNCDMAPDPLVAPCGHPVRSCACEQCICYACEHEIKSFEELGL